MSDQGLDAAFLEFIRAPDPDAHRRVHEFYLPFFGGLHRVADLACGEGTFVELLWSAGHAALGVDADPGCCARARAKGLTVAQAEVTTWLIAQPDASWDGLFCAHLIEHLPYASVLGLFRQARRVLRPGGRLVVVTPNVRALVSHLEMFYLHFGHISFYHPHLLAFFAQQAGFASTQEGENPRLARPMFGSSVQAGGSPADGGPSVRAGGSPADGGPSPCPSAAWPGEEPTMPGPTPMPPLRYQPVLPRRRGPLGAVWWHLKMTAVRFLVRPYLDPMVADLNQAIAIWNSQIEAQRRRDALLAAATQQAEATRAQLEAVLDRLDRSFECYVVADVGSATTASGSGENKR